jgi:hypothetical protein
MPSIFVALQLNNNRAKETNPIFKVVNFFFFFLIYKSKDEGNKAGHFFPLSKQKIFFCLQHETILFLK